ncbi:MAG TPA: hypothetical protein VJB57_15415 [Dehalococcoidia bacterium]|nr:hypothetical protein [Dehalococcoidia bacterium]
MFKLRLFRKAEDKSSEMSVEVVRALVEASRARRSPREALDEMMRLGNQELRPDAWLQTSEQESLASSEGDAADSSADREVERLIALLAGEKEDQTEKP